MAQVTRKRGRNQNKHWRVKAKAAGAARGNIAWQACLLRVEDLKMIEFIENAIELNRMSFKTRKSRPELDF